MSQTTKKPKYRLYENTTKSQEKWLYDMEKLLLKIPKDFYLNADCHLHVFSKFTDDTCFEPCYQREAEAAHIKTFNKPSCDG